MFLLGLQLNFSKHYFIEADFQEAFKAPFYYYYYQKPFPWKQTLVIFRWSLLFKASESQCTWNPTQHSRRPLNGHVFQGLLHIQLLPVQHTRQRPVFTELPTGVARTCWSMPVTESLPTSKADLRKVPDYRCSSPRLQPAGSMMPIQKPQIKPSHLTELTGNLRFQAEDYSMSGLEETSEIIL